MGAILSRFRKEKPSLEDQLEKIDKDLTEIRRFQIDTELEQKRTIGRLTIFLLFIYFSGVLISYFFVDAEALSWRQMFLALLPLLGFPVFIWALRRLFNWWYHRKIEGNKDKSNSLRKEREKLLDEVMEKETFKVAKKILEKYAPSHLLPKYLADQQRSGGTPLGRQLPQPYSDPLRRRTMGGPVGTPPQRAMMGGYRPPFRPPLPRAIMASAPGGATPRFRGPPPAMSSVPTGFTPVRYMLPQTPSAPVLHNRKTGWVDKLVDYVVGDGPTHRFALICRYCATHNGLATPDDYPYTGYRCIYCRQFNPPKERRPSAPTLPKNTVLIEELNSSREGTSINSENEAGDSETEERNRNLSPDSETASGEPTIDLQGSSTSDETEEAHGQEEEEPIPFADEDKSSEEDEETTVRERQIQGENSIVTQEVKSEEDEGTVTAKLSVNFHLGKGGDDEEVDFQPIRSLSTSEDQEPSS